VVQELINTAVQLAIVLLVALVVWAIFGRKKSSFPAYVGLTAPTSKAMLWALCATLVLTPLSISAFYFTSLRELASGANTVAGDIRALGLSVETWATILVVAFLKTALSEEIFFRGLIAKRLINALGFGVGNSIHAAIFGAVHLLIFVVPGGPAWDWIAAGAFFGVSALGGWVSAWLNEKVGNGSILPSWLLHGVSNAAAYPILAFF
jgi:membrane protease YdiL (CAAX protease family)